MNEETAVKCCGMGCEDCDLIDVPYFSPSKPRPGDKKPYYEPEEDDPDV